MKVLMYKRTAVLSLTLVVLSAHADQSNLGKGISIGEAKKNSSQGSAGKPLSMATGVVVDVDKENRSITLKHGPLRTKTIEMGPMTMPFAVKDAKQLFRVKVGDTVEFSAEYLNEVMTITSLRVQK